MSTKSTRFCSRSNDNNSRKWDTHNKKQVGIQENWILKQFSQDSKVTWVREEWWKSVFIIIFFSYFWGSFIFLKVTLNINQTNYKVRNSPSQIKAGTFEFGKIGLIFKKNFKLLESGRFLQSPDWWVCWHVVGSKNLWLIFRERIRFSFEVLQQYLKISKFGFHSHSQDLVVYYTLSILGLWTMILNLGR